MRPALIAVILSGCATVAPPAQISASLVPAPAGIDVAGTGQEIGFGRHIDGAIAAVSLFEGAPVSDIGTTCRVVGYASGLRLYFTGNAFSAWSYDGATAGEVCAP